MSLSVSKRMARVSPRRPVPSWRWQPSFVPPAGTSSAWAPANRISIRRSTSKMQRSPRSMRADQIHADRRHRRTESGDSEQVRSRESARLRAAQIIVTSGAKQAFSTCAWPSSTPVTRRSFRRPTGCRTRTWCAGGREPVTSMPASSRTSRSRRNS